MLGKYKQPVSCHAVTNQRHSQRRHREDYKEERVGTTTGFRRVSAFRRGGWLRSFSSYYVLFVRSVAHGVSNGLKKKVFLGKHHIQNPRASCSRLFIVRRDYGEMDTYDGLFNLIVHFVIIRRWTLKMVDRLFGWFFPDN